MKLWPVAPFFHSLLVGFSFQKENPTKSEWKKRGNRSEFHSEINYYLQNWYFSSSKMAPGILLFSIAMAPDYSFDVKNICIWAAAIFKHNNSFIATVCCPGTSNRPRQQTKLHPVKLTIPLNKLPCFRSQNSKSATEKTEFNQDTS